MCSKPLEDAVPDRGELTELSGEQRDRAFAALGDPHCRQILAELAVEPRTADELAETCDIPSSTLYRKLATLGEGGLIDKGVEISTRGRNATRYHQRFEELLVRIAESGVTVAVPTDDGAE